MKRPPIREYVSIATALALVALASGRRAAADIIAQVPTSTALNPTDSVNWNALFSNGQSVSNPFTVSSANGNSVTGSTAGNFEALTQGSSFFGGFASGERVLFDQGANDTITLTFTQSLGRIGADIDTSAYGGFSATLAAYDSTGHLLGTANIDGVSEYDVGTAPFLGLADLSGANISRVVFSATMNDDSGFAIDPVELSYVPEPTALAILGLASATLFLRPRPKRLRGDQ